MPSCRSPTSSTSGKSDQSLTWRPTGKRAGCSGPARSTSKLWANAPAPTRQAATPSSTTAPESCGPSHRSATTSLTPAPWYRASSGSSCTTGTDAVNGGDVRPCLRRAVFPPLLAPSATAAPSEPERGRREPFDRSPASPRRACAAALQRRSSAAAVCREFSSTSGQWSLRAAPESSRRPPRSRARRALGFAAPASRGRTRNDHTASSRGNGDAPPGTVQLTTRTFWACGPFGPLARSNSTLSFSSRFR